MPLRGPAKLHRSGAPAPQPDIVSLPIPAKTVTDGGPTGHDLTVNKTITDPGGPGAEATDIPTLRQCLRLPGLLLFTLAWRKQQPFKLRLKLTLS